MENKKTLIPIENCGFSGNYYYNLEYHSIYSIENSTSLFELKEFSSNNFDLETQLKICEQMLYAYEMGINKQKETFKNKINDIFDL